MCLFTADEFSGKLITCNEGDLKWVDKTIVPTLPTWEGDAIFLKLLLENEENFFTLKLVYEGESLVDQKLEIYQYHPATRLFTSFCISASQFLSLL